MLYVRRFFSCLLVVIAVLAIPILAQTPSEPPANPETLSPPQWTLWKKIRYTVGETPGVTVDPLDESATPFVVRIHVQHLATAQAFAAILEPEHELGNMVVKVVVLDDSGSPATPQKVDSSSMVALAFHNALRANPMFVLAREYNDRAVGVIFTRSVVQFYNDDGGELYSNFNGVAAQVFGDLVTRRYPGVRVWLGTQHPGAIFQ